MYFIRTECDNYIPFVMTYVHKLIIPTTVLIKMCTTNSEECILIENIELHTVKIMSRSGCDHVTRAPPPIGSRQAGIRDK